MKVIILAAGKGKRLIPLTEKVPKTLLKVGGKTILQRAIDTLLECGVKDIIVVVGAHADKVIKVVNDYKNPRIETVLNKDYEITDNMVSVMLCEEKCIGEPIVIMNGDLIFSKDVIQESLNAEFSNMPIMMGSVIKDAQNVLIKDNILKIISKSLSRGHGSAINIAKLSKEDAKIYFNHIRNIVESGIPHNQWWETALGEIFSKINVRPIEVKKGLWTEVDDYKDLEKAERLVEEYNKDQEGLYK